MPRHATEAHVKSRTPSGTYTGNGTSQEIECGFLPSRVRIYSEDNKYVIRKFGTAPTKGMGRMKVGGGSSTALRGLTVTNGGITFTDTGFTVGSNNAVNQNTVAYYWEAFE